MVERLVEILKGISSPRVTEEYEDEIEEEVGDSVIDAYITGREHGVKLGRYLLAQELLKHLK